MGKSVVEQKLLEYPDVFADVYNAYCFGGELILKEEELVNSRVIQEEIDSVGELVFISQILNFLIENENVKSSHF